MTNSPSREQRGGATLDGYPIVLRIPVQWGDMDAYGHVNNTILFRYFESARVEFLVRCGFARSWQEDRIGAILHSTGCRFRRPLFYPDTVRVGTRALNVAEDRFDMEYLVVSEASGEVVAEGKGVVVSFDYNSGRKCPIPSAVRAGITAIDEGRAQAHPET